MIKISGAIVLSMSLLVACKGKEESKPGATTVTTSAAVVTFASDADYEAKGLATLDKMTAIFKGAGADCDKLAANMSRFIDDNRALIIAAEDYGEGHPDAKKALEAKLMPKIQEMTAAMEPAMRACEDHKGLEAAMGKMPD